ncbi:MAG: hypothetical protein WCI11_17895 [Candidatus Methylumidiphilus sp.]
MKKNGSTAILISTTAFLIPTYHASNIGDGAVAQGERAVAAGKGSVAVGSNVTGNITIGHGGD